MVDAVIGLLPATLAALTMASFFAAGPTILAIVGICFAVGGGIGTLGALGGWLRRINLERTR